jgi:hypothetical protein
MLTWKLRITVLWIFLAVCQLTALALLMFAPGAIHDLMAGYLWGANTHSTAVQIWTASCALAPMAMAYLTLVLPDAASRWTNAVLGAVAAASGFFALIGQPSGTSAGADVAVIVAILVALLIVWHARKWPRRAEVPPVTPSRQMPEAARR